MPRGYDNSTRAAAARATRARVVEAARDLLIAGGYPSMTIASLAGAAGVSPQTIYNSIGGKAAVVKACYDVTLAGDDEPVPMAERPAVRALAQATSGDEFLTAYAAWCRTVYERTGPLLAGLAPHGAAGDPELEAFFATLDEERRTGTSRAITALFTILGRRSGTRRWRHAVDATWTLNSPEVHTALVGRSGWTNAEYERWLLRHLRTELLADTTGEDR